jgi:ADP-ribose pyrophosphatase
MPPGPAERLPPKVSDRRVRSGSDVAGADVAGTAGEREPLPTVLRSEVVHQGKVISLRVDEVSLPRGRRTTREVVEHPGAVVVIALDEKGGVPLVRQYRHAVGRYLLELPAGGLEPGEEPLTTAQRELMEEVGLEAARWTSLGHFFSSPGFSNEILHVFLAEDLREAHADPDEDEDIVVVVHSLRELYEHPEQLEDAKSLAALLLLRKASGDGRHKSRGAE